MQYMEQMKLPVKIIHWVFIFTHLKLCLAPAIHNYKWVKICCSVTHYAYANLSLF